MSLLDKTLYHGVEFVEGQTKLLAKVEGDSVGPYYAAVFLGINWAKDRALMYTASRLRLRYTSQVISCCYARAVLILCLWSCGFPNCLVCMCAHIA